MKLIDGVKIISEQISNPLIINFKEDYISLSKEYANKSTKTDRVIDLKEFTFFELLNQSKLNTKSSGIYLAEAHSRNVFSLTPIIFCMIFLTFFLRFEHSRYDNIFKKSLIISLVFFIQIILVSMKNIITKFEGFMYFFYIIPILILIICFVFIKYETFTFLNLKKVKNGSS